MSVEPYNPLNKQNLAHSIKNEILRRDCIPLSDVEKIRGAGVYVIYYTRDSPVYAPLSNGNRDGVFSSPIYIGKAIPKGGRKGGISKDSSVSRALAERLRHHVTSVDEAGNLKLEHFFVRHLVVEDIWIPLGENNLIESFGPVWNRAIDGFGNKDPGNRRKTQFKSPWDVLHPGRKFTEKLADNPASLEFFSQRVQDYFDGKPLAKLPKALEEQQAADLADAEERADEV